VEISTLDFLHIFELKKRNHSAEHVFGLAESAGRNVSRCVKFSAQDKATPAAIHGLKKHG
jgi:hypothetical protein